MGRRGPRKKPTELELVQGNPGRRPVRKREPKPDRRRPDPPPWLSDEASAVWAEVEPQLSDMRVLTKADAHALACYCTAFARWRAAEQWIATHGEAFPMRAASTKCKTCSGVGSIVGVECDDCKGAGEILGAIRCFQQFPQVSVARQLLETVRRYQQEFGLTPSARTSIDADLDEDEDPDDARFFQTG